jgi:UV DNA damage endonuclease
MKLGFAVKVLGREGLKSNDARRWQNSPHLRVSIEYVSAIFDYLAENQIAMYRISSDFAPYLTHPTFTQFHGQLDEARGELEALGEKARRLKLRLSFHPSQYILLNSPDEKLFEASRRDFLAQAQMLDIMEQGAEAVVVTHVGGVYGDREASIARFIANFARLPQQAQRRLVVENDDVSYGVGDILRIHEATGIRCIFDHQHHNIINDGRDAETACAQVLATWPSDCVPKIHFSSPRRENRTIERRDRKTGKIVRSEAAPLASQHAEMIEVETFAPFVRAVAEKAQRDFDVMCEAKGKDLAVLQLREKLRLQAMPFPIA